MRGPGQDAPGCHGDRKAGQGILGKAWICAADAQGNKASLVYSLLLLAHCAPSSILPKGIRAVATLLELETMTQCTEAVLLHVMKRLDPFLAIVEHMAEIVEEATVEARQAADRLYSTCEDA